MIDRKQLINFIPKPKNEEVIIYDIDLKDLIDVDVFEEYYKLLPIYLSKKDNFITIQNKINEYNNTINNIYLLNSSWSEEDYLIKLNNAKKTYSTLYNEIKIIEDNMKIIDKKIKAMNEKIELQKVKENKMLKEKLDNIDIDIQKNKEKLLDFKDKLNSYESILLVINKNIQENEEELEFLNDMENNLKIGNYKCKYCGSTVKVYSENSLIFKRLQKNIIDNKNDANKLSEKRKDIELEIAYYQSEISKIKTTLNNDIHLKENNNIYAKKTLEILKLEALRDELINNKSKLEKQLKSYSCLNTTKYKDLKQEINNYELSLNNLKKIKKIKKEMQDLIENYNNIKNDFNETFNTMKKYIQYLSIYFKICEQKLNNYFGKDYKFKLVNFEENMQFKEILKIQYKGIDYLDLPEKDKDEVDKEISLKISLFN